MTERDHHCAGLPFSLTFCMSGIPTAFTNTARSLRSQLREAVLDHESFETPLRPCDLSRCRASCCHDGAILSPEEAEHLRELLNEDPAAFPAAAQKDAITQRNQSHKTATRPALRHECAEDFPSHFARTRCVFLDDEHKCTLQLLSRAQGKHPWFYKPVSCWMHPVFLRPADHASDRPCLTLRTPDHNQARFATCTHCGRPDQDGIPAKEVLHEELAALSILADRDFAAELHAPSIDS